MKQEIDFVKVSPTQNMTILVTTSHPRNDYIPIASRLMSYDSVHAEQVGFICRPTKQGAHGSLQMAGGEFCGNACMAMAAYLAIENGLQTSGIMELSLESSGSEHLVPCRVSKVNETYFCRVTMPLPGKVEQKSVYYEGEDLSIAIVRYESFFHIVIEVESFSLGWREKAEGLARLLGITPGTNLIGVLLFEPQSSRMNPLIYLPELDSMVWEKGCGSGTASIGAYLSWKRKADVACDIAQPGGTIFVSADYSEQGITSLAIEGAVGIVALGKAFIESGGSGRDANSHEISAMLS
ncbi:diaminopimelate epimerase [Paenibacillus sp. ATY16]|uniref:diaminopimelate epimerase n=1 Tax=Paenibacillus sp. ATY16 TaxID=1759312 RepID=UPI00200EB977|nr:diaminopimelate epimerase [Paenibacillus sp. ATY16]MCK9859669.1 diaminopimelate epimerase [Paenibacillus sp. ATY16]